MTFQFYSDSGHGWLRVDVQSAASVGLDPSDFSPYSYQRAHWLYLEEDCDASLFVNAYMAKHSRTPPIKMNHTNGRSCIRNYDRLPSKEKVA